MRIIVLTSFSVVALLLSIVACDTDGDGKSPEDAAGGAKDRASGGSSADGGESNAGGESAGAESAGAESAGAESAGAESAGAESAGAESAGGASDSDPEVTETAPPFDRKDCEAEAGPNAAVAGSGIGAFRDDDSWMDGWTNWSLDSTPEDTNASTDVKLSGVLDDMELDADTVYELDGYVYVPAGRTLKIPAGTLIKSEGKGNLIVSRGGTIEATGTAEKPIVFTSKADNGHKDVLQWGGIFILGRAPNSKGENDIAQGLFDDPDPESVGYDCDPTADVDDLSDPEEPIHKCRPDESSGILEYVRIEFGGVGLWDETNGLTLAAVGSGTIINHIQVNTSFDDAFEWFGGTVNADHLVANNAGDDSFDMDHGYTGTVEYLFSRQVAPTKSDPNGFEWDGSLKGETPATNPTVRHGTLCGLPGNPTFGAVLRENVTATIDDVAFVGFDATLDTRNGFDHDDVSLTNAYSWHMVEGISVDESEVCHVDASLECDNDEGFSETDWFEGETSNTNFDSSRAQ